MIEIDIGYNPRKWQEEVHLALARYKILAVHRRAGKTEIALQQLIDAATEDRRATALYIYVAPFANQANRIAWRRLKKLIDPFYRYGLCKIYEQDKAIEFKHGPRIQLYGADNPDNIRGTTLMGAVLDEVAQMPPETWYEVIYPALQDQRGWALFIGTPGGTDLFSKLYYEKQNAIDWFVKSYTVYDTKVFTSKQIEEFKREMPDEAFAREFLCDFNVGGTKQLISLVDVYASRKRKLNADDVKGMPKILACDPARFGDDTTAIIKRVGMHAFDLEMHRGMDNMEIAARLALIATKYKPDVIFVDGGGPGAGVIDRLKQLGFGQVIEVQFGSRATNPTYYNLRTEMWMKMRDWIKSGGIIPDNDRLAVDLTGPTYSISRSDKWQLESKDDMKKRGLNSPDCADALAMTFAQELNLNAFSDNNPDFSRKFDPYYSWGGQMLSGTGRMTIDFNPLKGI